MNECSCRFLKNKDLVNTRHTFGWTALMVAVVNEQYEMVKILLAAGADPNLGDNFINITRTASQKGIHRMEVLMAREKEFAFGLSDKAVFLGFTALHYAALTNNLDIIKLLLSHGADPCVENDLGHRPIHYTNDEEIKLLLELEVVKVNKKYNPKFNIFT